MLQESVQEVIRLIQEKLESLNSQLLQMEKIETMHQIVEEAFGPLHPEKVDDYYRIIENEKPNFEELKSKIENDKRFLSSLKMRIETKYKSLLEVNTTVTWNGVSAEDVERYSK